jgi:hypothetical protein
MPEENMQTPKWNWVKEKTAEALINAVVLAFVMLIGYGVLQAFLGEWKLDKTSDKLRKEIVDKHNESIARESELLGQIAELRARIEAKAEKPADPPMALYAPNLVPNPSNQPNPAQQRLDFEQKHRMQYKE